MADTVGAAYLSLVPKLEEGWSDTIKTSLSGGLDGSALGELFGGEFLGKAQAVLAEGATKLAVPLAVAGVGVAVGKELYDVGESFDTMYDSISVGTGATGDALAGLEQSARNVASNTSASIDDIGTTLADLNTRTGATGDTLEGLTTQFAQLGEMGQSADVNTVTGAFNAWGISAEDMGDSLDDLFLVSQNTGIGIDELASTMSTNAASMQTLGFSFQDTAAMAGLFDKAGLNSSSMMNKLSKAATTLAKDGQEPAEAFQETIDKMQEYIDAGDEASAIDVASELFGTKGASQFVQALETGTMDIDALSETLANSTGDISSNAEATASWDQNMQRLQNNAMLLLEPLGSAVFTGASNVLGVIADAAGNAYSGIKGLYDAVMANEDVQSALKSISSIMSSVGSIAKSAFKGLQSALSPLRPVISAVAGVLGGAFATAARTVSNVLKVAANVMKGFKALFSGKISFPHISLPHITISPKGWGPADLLKGKIPSLGVKFYATGAYNLTNPQMAVVGDADEPEHVLRDSDLTKIAQRMGSQGGANTYNITVNTQATDGAQFAQEFVTYMRRRNALEGC